MPTMPPTNDAPSATVSSVFPPDAGHELAPANAAAWIQAKADQVQAKLRLPIVLGAQRLGLSSTRCRQLEEQIDEIRTRLLNVPPGTSPSIVLGLESTLLRLEDQLHRERLALFKDLLPLAEQARDAAIESMRAAWLNELTRSLGGEDR